MAAATTVIVTDAARILVYAQIRHATDLVGRKNVSVDMSICPKEIDLLGRRILREEVEERLVRENKAVVGGKLFDDDRDMLARGDVAGDSRIVRGEVEPGETWTRPVRDDNVELRALEVVARCRCSSLNFSCFWVQSPTPRHEVSIYTEVLRGLDHDAA